MESELRANLIRLKQAYLSANEDMSPATLGQKAAGDWRYFDRLENDEGSFTARKYDEIVGWFSANWPPKTRWPGGIKRPAERAGAA